MVLWWWSRSCLGLQLCLVSQTKTCQRLTNLYAWCCCYSMVLMCMASFVVFSVILEIISVRVLGISHVGRGMTVVFIM